MKIYRDESLRNFEAWGGARDVLEKLIERGTVDDFESMIDECYPEGLEETTLNDILWFEDELTADFIGEWELIDWKVVRMEDGSHETYKWYKRDVDELNIFTFDEEPNRDYADWEAWSEEEAKEWFDCYGKEV